MKRADLEILFHYFQDVRDALTSYETYFNHALFKADLDLIHLLVGTAARRVTPEKILRKWERYRAAISTREYLVNPWLTRFTDQFEKKLLPHFAGSEVRS